MARRRLLVDAEVDSNKHTCGRCRYLSGPPAYCELFTGALDEHQWHALRADECLVAEARFKLAYSTKGTVSDGS